MGNSCSRKGADNDLNYKRNLYASKLTGLAKKIDEIPEMEIKNILMNWCEAKLETTCSQQFFLQDAVNGMYKEVEHADYMIKQSLKNSEKQIEKSLDLIETNNVNEIKFFRDNLFYDDEELYLYIQRLFIKENESKQNTNSDFPNASGSSLTKPDVVSKSEEVSKLILSKDIILNRETNLEQNSPLKASLTFQNPSQTIVRTRQTTMVTWAVWDDYVALGDADGYISFVDCKNKKYQKNNDLKNPHSHERNPNTKFAHMVFMDENKLLTVDTKNSVQVFDIKSRKRLACYERQINYELNPGKYQIQNKVRNQIMFRSHTREFTILSAQNLVKIRKVFINQDIEYALGEIKDFFITEFMDYLFVISDSNYLYVFDLNNCKIAKKINMGKKITDIVICDNMIKDTCIVYIGHVTGEITIVSFNKSNKEFETLSTIKGKSCASVKSLTLSQSKKYLVGLYADKSIMIVNVETKEIQNELFLSVQINFDAISFGKNENTQYLRNRDLTMPLSIFKFN